MPITALIVDDEAMSRTTVRDLLQERHAEIRLVGLAKDVPEGIALVRSLDPDLIFLDVEMGELTGFDLLKALAPVRAQVIFTTAHVNYAVRAIKFNALDFLLKPIVPEELDAAVAKVLDRGVAPPASDRFNALLGSVVSERQIALPVSDGLVIVHLDDILHLSSDDNYTEVHPRDGKRLVISRPLSEFDQFLEGQGFLRIHQSHLVNRKHVRRYIKGEGGEVVLTDGSHLPVSRRKKQELLEALERI
ncbi:MAG: response regulator transcription factor [Flavobacteriales bacterium]|nr:response regulator transcription factor [Flavobacteriales bacterium]